VRDVTVPLIRFGLVSSWLLCFMIFVREYSTGVYLQGPGTEVLGALIVSLFGGGSLELVAALSVVNVALVAAGLCSRCGSESGCDLLSCEPQRRMQQYGGAGSQMLGLGMFAHIVAQPADARYEDHAGRASRAIICASWPAPDGSRAQGG
jgi:hypothetical protein